VIAEQKDSVSQAFGHAAGPARGKACSCQYAGEGGYERPHQERYGHAAAV